MTKKMNFFSKKKKLTFFFSSFPLPLHHHRHHQKNTKYAKNPLFFHRTAGLEPEDVDYVNAHATSPSSKPSAGPSPGTGSASTARNR